MEPRENIMSTERNMNNSKNEEKSNNPLNNEASQAAISMRAEDQYKLLKKLRPELGDVINVLTVQTVSDLIANELKKMPARKEELTFEEKVMNIQSEIEVGKDKYNSFGKYAYRDLESIFSPLKKLLKKYRLMLQFDDEIITVENRYYVRSTVYLTDGHKKLSARGLAREPDAKKGMDSSQVTGMTLSYARKYAVQALLLISEPDPDSVQPESSYNSSAIEGTKMALEIKGYLDVYGAEAKKKFANGHTSVKEMNYEERKSTLEALKEQFGALNAE